MVNIVACNSDSEIDLAFDTILKKTGEYSWDQLISTARGLVEAFTFQQEYDNSTNVAEMVGIWNKLCDDIDNQYLISCKKVLVINFIEFLRDWVKFLNFEKLEMTKAGLSILNLKNS